MEHILLPSHIEFRDSELPDTGLLVLSPCHQGYGTTIGNALRRVLLSSLPGSAPEFMKIDGASHEFSAVEGVAEDVVEIIMNVKQIAIRSFSETAVVMVIEKKGKGPVTLGDMEKNSVIEVANPELVLCNITDDKKTFRMELTIGNGRGYVPASEKQVKNLELGTIAIDSLYTPIRDVGYDVELTRVGDVTDYEKLTVNVVTNGTLSPKEAVSQAAGILIDHFALLTSIESVENLSGVLNEEVLAEAEEVESGESLEEEKPRTKSKKKKSS